MKEESDSGRRHPRRQARRSGMQRAVDRARELNSGLSGQVWLAQRLGVTQQSVSEWLMRGWAPIKRADEIAQLTGVPAEELLEPRLVKMLVKVAQGAY